VCGSKFQTVISSTFFRFLVVIGPILKIGGLSDLSDPVDVYTAWIDETEKANKLEKDFAANADAPEDADEKVD